MKNENKNEVKRTKEKALADYGKPYKGKFTNCGKYGHKSTDTKYTKNIEKDEK